MPTRPPDAVDDTDKLVARPTKRSISRATIFVTGAAFRRRIWPIYGLKLASAANGPQDSVEIHLARFVLQFVVFFASFPTQTAF